MNEFLEFIKNIPGQVLYSAGVFVFFLIVLAIALRTLRRATDQREKRLKKKKADPLVTKPTGTMKKGMTSGQKSRFESIENQFTITRKLLVPIVISIGIILALLPFATNVPAAYLTMFATILSVIIGMAARPFLENIFAGLVISYSKSLNIGDTVLIGDQYGTVEDINLSYTTIKTWDWKRYVIPNINMISRDFINYTLIEKYQWVYIEFWSAYDNDLEEVERIAVDCSAESEYTLEDNVPSFWIMEMDKDCYKCWVASWASDPSNAWNLRNDLRTRLIKEFRKKGIKVCGILSMTVVLIF
jgi:small-conductance mechanosensitive channel